MQTPPCLLLHLNSELGGQSFFAPGEDRKRQVASLRMHAQGGGSPPHSRARRFASSERHFKNHLSLHEVRSSNLRSQAPSFTPVTRAAERILVARSHRS